MKKALLLVLAFLATEASAADSIFVTTELIRNGEVIDKFSGHIMNGSTFPYRNIQSIPYAKAIRGGRAVIENLEVGTVASITPTIIDDGKILVRYKVDYVRMTKLDTTKVGNLRVDLPQTESFNLSSNTVIASGETVEVPYAKDENSRYVYKITAQIQ